MDFSSKLFLNTSTPRDLSIAHGFDGEGVGFWVPLGDEKSAFTINLLYSVLIVKVP